MSKGEIRLSPKYGVNPSVMKCFYCGEAFGVALPGLLRGDREAPHSAVWDMTPCDRCRDVMKEGILLVSIDPEKSDPKEGIGGFWRTGRVVGLKEEAFTRIIADEGLKKFGLKNRWMFISDEALDKLLKPEEEEECNTAT